MTIRERTMYEVVCDKCGKVTGDVNGEFTAWNDPGAAVDDWTVYDGQSYQDGSHCCSDCAWPSWCWGDENQGDHEFDDGVCTRCDAREPV